MSVNGIGTHNSSGNNPTIAFTVSTACSIGTLAVVFVQDGNSGQSGITVTDSKSNAYALGPALSAGGLNCSMFYSLLTTALTTSDTVTYHMAAGFGNVNSNIIGAAATGYGSADVVTPNAGSGSSAGWTITGAGSPAVANELYFSLVATSALPTQSSSFTTLPSPAAFVLPAYAVNPGIPALTYAGTMTSSAWIALIMAFKPSGPFLSIPSAGVL